MNILNTIKTYWE